MSRRRGSALLSSAYGGVNKVAPVLAGFFLVAALSCTGSCPVMVSFVGEFLVLARRLPAATCGSVLWPPLGIVLTAAYVLAPLPEVA